MIKIREKRLIKCQKEFNEGIRVGSSPQQQNSIYRIVGEFNKFQVCPKEDRPAS